MSRRIKYCLIHSEPFSDRWTEPGCPVAFPGAPCDIHDAMVIGLDGIPEEWVERGAKVMLENGWTCTAHEPEPCTVCDVITQATVEAVLESILGDPE